MNNQIPFGYYMPNNHMNMMDSYNYDKTLQNINKSLENLEKRVKYLEFLANNNYNIPTLNKQTNKTIDNGYPFQNENYMI